jgi:RNA polymerase sigma factor (sigma-70 family)
VIRPSVRLRSLALARLCQFDVLGVDEERHLFRQLQEAREQAARSRRAGSRRIPTGKSDGSAARAIEIRNRIALCNLRLVVSVAKRFASPQQSLEDLVSEASLLLLRCVERFDAGRGTRFSTYATRALNHHFVRLCRRERRRGLRSLSSVTLERTHSSAPRCQALERLIHLEDLQRLDERFADLSPRERNLLAGRFGMNGNDPRTFRELAVSQGLSKEWARVTSAGAIERLRNSLTDECSL